MPSQNNDTKEYWFPAKRYGWGWGIPQVWQGWVTGILYTCSILVVAYMFPPKQKTALFISLTVILTICLLLVCWIKGEPPRWRWGDDEKD